MKLSAAAFFAFLTGANAGSMNITGLVFRYATYIPVMHDEIPRNPPNSTLSFTLHHQINQLSAKQINCAATWKYSSKLPDWTRCDNGLYWWRFAQTDDNDKNHFTLEVVHSSNETIDAKAPARLIKWEPWYAETIAVVQFGEVGDIVGGRLFCAAEVLSNSKTTIRKCTSISDPVPLEVIHNDKILNPISLSPVCLRYNATRNTEECSESIEFYIGVDKMKDAPLCKLEWDCENSTAPSHRGRCKGYSDGEPFDFMVAVRIAQQERAYHNIPVNIALQREGLSRIPLDREPLKHSLYWPTEGEIFKMARTYLLDIGGLPRNGEGCEMLDSGSWKTAQNLTSHEAVYIGGHPFSGIKILPNDNDERTHRRKTRPPPVGKTSGFPISKAPWMPAALITTVWLLVHGL